MLGLKYPSPRERIHFHVCLSASAPRGPPAKAELAALTSQLAAATRRLEERSEEGARLEAAQRGLQAKLDAALKETHALQREREAARAQRCVPPRESAVVSPFQRGIGPDANPRLQEYPWPGGLRV